MNRSAPCSSGKKIYATKELATEALIEARIQFEYGSGKGPVAVYRCDDCSYFHLTSQGSMNEKLKNYLATGKIDKQKEANRWLAKFKHK